MKELNYTVALLVCVLLTSMVFAGPAKKSASPNISMDILNGELRTTFKLDSGSNTLAMANSRGVKKSRKIGKSDYQFIYDQVKKLPSLANIPHECYRARMEILVTDKNAKTERKVSCFGMKAVASEQFQRIASLLAVSI